MLPLPPKRSWRERLRANFELIAVVTAVTIIAAAVIVDTAQRPAAAVTAQAPTARLVTIDPVELANAERALASKLLTRHGNRPATRRRVTLKLFRVGREMRATIRAVAGPGTIVLVKQAVIAGSVPDITKTVLMKLGLPAKVPTVDLTTYLTHGVAATTLSFSQINAALKARAKAQERHSAATYHKLVKSHADSIVP